MHHRNVNDRRETIKNIKRLIRRKEKDNEQLDADLEELALSVAERRNVNEANGQWNRLYLHATHFFFRFSSFYHKREMKSANFMRRYYTLEQEKIWTESEEIKWQHSVIQNLIFSRFSQAWLFKQQSFSLYNLTSVCIFSILFSIHCLRC